MLGSSIVPRGGLTSLLRNGARAIYTQSSAGTACRSRQESVRSAMERVSMLRDKSMSRPFFGDHPLRVPSAMIRDVAHGIDGDEGACMLPIDARVDLARRFGVQGRMLKSEVNGLPYYSPSSDCTTEISQYQFFARLAGGLGIRVEEIKQRESHLAENGSRRENFPFMALAGSPNLCRAIVGLTEMLVRQPNESRFEEGWDGNPLIWMMSAMVTRTRLRPWQEFRLPLHSDGGHRVAMMTIKSSMDAQTYVSPEPDFTDGGFRQYGSDLPSNRRLTLSDDGIRIVDDANRTHGIEGKPRRKGCPAERVVLIVTQKQVKVDPNPVSESDVDFSQTESQTHD